MARVQVFVDGLLQFDRQFGDTPANPGVPISPPVAPSVPSQPAPANSQDLGTMLTGSPADNLHHSLQPGVVYYKAVPIAGLHGYVEFKSLPASNEALEGNYEDWLSATPGGEPLGVYGCEKVELSGANVSQHVVLMEAVKMSLLNPVLYFNLVWKGATPTGRAFQHNP